MTDTLHWVSMVQRVEAMFALSGAELFIARQSIWRCALHCERWELRSMIRQQYIDLLKLRLAVLNAMLGRLGR